MFNPFLCMLVGILIQFVLNICYAKIGLAIRDDTHRLLINILLLNMNMVK